MARENEAEFLHTVLQGYGPAIDYIQALARVSQVFDDVVDGDKPVSKEAMTRAVWDSLVAIPMNSFFRAYIDTLAPMTQAFVQDWMDANVLEQGSDHDKDVAFVLRDNLYSILIHMAHIIGGYDWATSWGPEIRRHIHEDSLTEYKEGLA